MGSFNMYVITSLFATFTALSSFQFDGAYPGELCSMSHFVANVLNSCELFGGSLYPRLPCLVSIVL